MNLFKIHGFLGKPLFKIPFVMAFGLFILTGSVGECRSKVKTIKVKIFKNPEPTCVEKEYVQLKLVGEVKEDINDKEFLVFPRSLIADGDGNIYVYDAMMGKVYKYNKQMRLQTTFGGKGVGPGEFGSYSRMGRGNIHLYLGDDNLIYAGDRRNRKIAVFDRNGKLIKEIRMEVQPFSYIKPVLDSKGNFYVHSKNGGIIDVFSKDGKLMHTLLDKKWLPYGLFFRLKKKLSQSIYINNDPDTILHERVKNGRLFVFHTNSGFLYIVDGNKLIKKTKLWPKNILQKYRKMLDFTINVDDIEMEGFFPYFQNMFVDKDNGQSIYLSFVRTNNEREGYVYQFDLEGNLMKVYTVTEQFDGYTEIVHKRNGIFYAFSRNKEGNKTIFTYKEELKK